MRITLKDWIALQKKNVRVCDGNEDVVPKVIFIGILKEDGTIESNVRLVSVEKWRQFEEIWKQISGQKNQASKDYLPPQFFLFCE